jgi:gamma-glutamyltranspeptidase
MVVTNHPLASAAGTEIMLAGGNAIDAAVASLFALTVVEPMMIGVLGGGIQHIRLANGRHHIIDSLGTAPLAAHANMYECLSDELETMRDTRGRENVLGVRAGAVPGSLAGWYEALALFGTMPLADIVAPAIRYAERGFIVTPYLSTCIRDCVGDLAVDCELSDLLAPGSTPLAAGERLVQPDYAESLKLVHVVEIAERTSQGEAFADIPKRPLDLAFCLGSVGLARLRMESIMEGQVDESTVVDDALRLTFADNGSLHPVVEHLPRGTTNRLESGDVAT